MVSSSRTLYEGAVELAVTGSGFVGDCTAELSAPGASPGAITQPVSVTLSGSTTIVLGVAPLASALQGHTIWAAVTCDGVSSCPGTLGTVAIGEDH